MFGCFGIGAVAVWVVFEGEGVELSILRSNCVSIEYRVDGMELGVYFFISAAVAVTGTLRIS